MEEKIIEILNNYVDLSVHARGGADKKILEAIVAEIESLIEENYYEKKFVEWLSYHVEWIDDSISFKNTNEFYDYWLKNIKDK